MTNDVDLTKDTNWLETKNFVVNLAILSPTESDKI